MSNVSFLKPYDPSLVNVFSKAESYIHDDPNTAIIKIRQFAEMLAQYTAVKVGIPEWERGTQVDLLNYFKHRGVFSEQALSLFHSIRKTGNRAVHAGVGSTDEALQQLKMAWQLAIVFHRAFSTEKQFTATFTTPKNIAQEEVRTANEKAKPHESRATQAEKELEELRITLKKIQESKDQASVKSDAIALQSIKEASNDLDLDEKTTRLLIDEQLRDAGWEADTEKLRYSKGTRPQKNKSIAIAEWPTESGNADYALFYGMTLLGVVEAKKKSVDVKGKLGQSQRYSKGIETASEVKVLGPWGDYRVPFLYSTNGRPYLEQLKDKSGIWFLDARRRSNLPRALLNWHTPEGLFTLAENDEDKAINELKTESKDYLPLRPYQMNAISAVEQAIIDGKREILIAMATGTGKTRTCIGLAYRLIKAGRFRRILFVVDRTSLGTQAADGFEELKVEDNKTFSQIYDIKGLDDISPDTATKVHFATVQALIKRVLYPTKDDGTQIPIDQYDCIVIDECHRGYTLDKTLSEHEFDYRDEEDYISKYRRVVEYFDAVKIGLTATPALHTTEIFGKPVYNYSYREAVIDGYLVDHQEPFKIKTKLSEDGITWVKGQTIKVYDPESSSIELAEAPDELSLDIKDFNIKVITEDFNRVVCEELVKRIEWDNKEKTLIFCARDDHADMVVRLLNEAFQKAYGDIDHDAIVKITANADKPLELIKRYKNEKFPSIAVTVDLLSTGIDVPEICNLVFIRRIKSRILYDQMVGRATRLCEEIGKEYFRIYDAAGLYEALEPFSAMKPVTPSPSITLAELSEQLRHVKKEETKKHIIDQILAKINARKRRIKGEALDDFKTITGGHDPESFVKAIKDGSDTHWGEYFDKLAPWLDQLKAERDKLFISDHQDELKSVDQGFGGSGRPEDYIEGFTKYIQENINQIQALLVVAKKPRELTKQQLREIKLELDKHGFKERSLQDAYKLTKQKDIAASLIGFIRMAAIGEPLLPFTDRLNNAMEKIQQRHSFTPVQVTWLNLIKKQIEKEYIVDEEALEKGAFIPQGGFQRANKIFNGNIKNILQEINELIWQQNAG